VVCVVIIAPAARADVGGAIELIVEPAIADAVSGGDLFGAT